MFSSGTKDKVTIQFYGHDTAYTLDHRYGGPDTQASDSKNEYTIPRLTVTPEDVGKTITVRAAKDGDDWMVYRIEIELTGLPMFTYVYRCNAWFRLGGWWTTDPTEQTFRVSQKRRNMIWNLRIYTSFGNDAGTRTNVRLTLHGTQENRTIEYKQSEGANFSKGAIMSTLVATPDYWSPVSLNVNGGQSADPWRLNMIEMKQNDYNDPWVYVFYCDCTLKNYYKPGRTIRAQTVQPIIFPQ